MVEEVASLASNGSDISTDVLTEIASEVINATLASVGEKVLTDIDNSILSAITAVEESTTGITGSAGDLVTQVIN